MQKQIKILNIEKIYKCKYIFFKGVPSLRQIFISTRNTEPGLILGS